MRTIVGVWVSTILTVAMWSQSPQNLSPRELFYSTSDGKSATGPKRVPNRSTPLQTGKSVAGRAPAVQASAPAANLGLRYNLMLQDTVSLQFEPVDVDREYQTGDCFVLDVEPNYSGYLYIFVRGSSGAWQPLFPFLTPGGNRVDAHREVRLPPEGCLELRPPSGVEHVFLVFGRDPQDFVQLNAAIVGTAPVDAAVAGPRPAPPVGPEGLEQAVDTLYNGLKDRDIGVKKIDKDLLPEEPPHSVYAVNMSPQPRKGIVAELRLRH